MIFNSGKSQMNFYMPPCSEKAEIYRIIQENGGRALKEDQAGCIYLLPYEPNFTLKESFSHPVYSYTLVLHSFSLQELQSLETYQLNTTSKSIPSQQKLSYTEKEDRSMRDFVEKTEGNPKNLSFWLSFKNHCSTNRSADSLRAHWKFLSSNQVTKKKEKKIPAFKQLLLDRANKKKQENLEIAEKMVKSPENSGSDELGERLTDDFAENEQSEKVLHGNDFCNIEKCFDDLIDAVSHVSKRRVPPGEIIDVLVECSGNVKATLEAFKKK